MCRRLLGVMVACLVGFAGGRSSKASPPARRQNPLEAAADRIATSKLASGDLPGMTIGIARRGRIVFVKGYGNADPSHHLAATSETIYRIGGLTEQFTATAVLRLVAQGKLDLDDDITKYVAVATRGHAVTIRDLLSHTSGLPEYAYGPDGNAWTQAKVTTAQILDRIAHQPWRDRDDGGSQSEYFVLGLAVAKVSGEPYARFLRDEVLARAGLRHTAPCDAIQGPVARGYTLYRDGLHLARSTDPSAAFASGDLCSTVPDLLAWAAAMSQGAIVSDRALERLAFASLPFHGHRHLSQWGGTTGYSAAIDEYPGDGLTIVVMTNADGLEPDRIEVALARAAFGIPSKAVPLPPELRESLVGYYEFADGSRTIVSAFRGRLSINGSTGVPFELEYRGHDTFVALDSHFTVVFQRAHGLVTGLISHQPGGDVEAKRVLPPNHAAAP